MSMQYSGTQITFPDSSTQNTAATGFGFKNRIINGAMMIDARNAGASVTPTDGAYTLDRWQAGLTQSSKFSVQQSSTAAIGFTNSLLCTSLSAYSVGSGDIFAIAQKIEGFNVADLGWGAIGAASVTLSFWVRSSLTGSFGGSLRNSAINRSYPFTYTINAANTWEQKSVTIAGDTSGTWLTTNGVGLNVTFSLGSGSTYSASAGSWAAGNYVQPTGSTSVVGTNGATFYLTGVQLEKGTTATSFDYRPYGTELALCQRYYYRASPASTTGMFGSGFCYSTTLAIGYLPFPVVMRTSPTALEQSGTATDYKVYIIGSSNNCTSVPSFNSADVYNGTIIFTSSGLTAGQGTILRANTTAAYLGWSAEL